VERSGSAHTQRVVSGGVIVGEPLGGLETVALVPVAEAIVSGVDFQADPVDASLGGAAEGVLKQGRAEAGSLVFGVNGEGIQAEGAGVEAERHGRDGAVVFPAQPDFLVVTAEAAKESAAGFTAFGGEAGGLQQEECRKVRGLGGVKGSGVGKA